jgi:hypothetical protein
MFLIVLNHYPWVEQNGHLPRLLNAILQSWGGVGDCLFFMISAWFLSAEVPSVRKSFRRAWVLERQLLAYSIPLFIVVLILVFEQQVSGLSSMGIVKLGMRSILPTLRILWWYPANYILFLLLFPWLSMGLKALSASAHRNLVVLSLAVSSFYPLTALALTKYSFALFIFLFILVSYVRWHMNDLSGLRRVPWTLVGVGAGVGIFGSMAVSMVFPSMLQRAYNYFNDPFLFPSLMIALGLVILASRNETWHSQVVNKIASATLATYLLLTYPYIMTFLTKTVFGVGVVDGTVSSQGLLSLPANPFLQIGVQVLAGVVLYVATLLLDFIRQFVFAHTLDSRGRRGRWFDALWNRVAASRVGAWLAS